MKILFVVPYPYDWAPSQRFRFEQYLAFLEEQNYQVKISAFIDSDTWRILYKPDYIGRKVLGIIKGFVKRFYLLFTVPAYDYVFIHREATPIGPPWFEWISAKILRKKIIYDFDDAIWLSNTSENNKIVAGIKWHHKVKSICTWSYKVSCGNRYLCDFASKFNSKVVLNPTTIDTIKHHNKIKNQNTKEFIIGWTGTHSTLFYLNEVVPILKILEDKIEFKFLVISNKEPDFKISSLEFRPWKEETEIEDLLEFNIGLMPLTQGKWSEGKCGFKALQYMALGIPALISPVGVNKEIVKNGFDGFLCSTSEEWERNILKLYNDVLLREEMGKSARAKVETNYSVNSNKGNFLNLFN